MSEITFNPFQGNVNATPASSPIEKGEKPSVTQTFLEYMKKSTEEKMFEAFLKYKGMTKEEFEALPDEKKEKLLKEFQQETKEKIRQKSGII